MVANIQFFFCQVKSDDNKKNITNKIDTYQHYT